MASPNEDLKCHEGFGLKIKTIKSNFFFKYIGSNIDVSFRMQLKKVLSL